MRVCLANDSFPPLIDGVSNTVVNYANIINRKYGSAIVATPKYPGVEDNFDFDVVRYTSLNTVPLVGYRTGYPFSHSAMERLAVFNPEIIHSHCPMASTFLCRELRDITGAPLIFTYHTKFDIDIKRAVKLKLVQEPAIREVIRNIEACDDVWVVNRGAGENLKSLGYTGNYIVMPNGVDIDTTPADPELVAKVEQSSGLLPGIPTFLFVGRVMWYKGLRIILDGLRQVADAGVDFRMMIVGSGDDLEAVKEYASQLGLAGRCSFPGAVYDRDLLKAYYSRADLFLLPSVFDNNPLVVKEAAACATASLLIRDSSSAEGAVDGENSVLISESSSELANRLLALCREPDKMRLLGECAQKTLYYSWDDSVARAEERYREVLANYHPGEHPKARYDGAIKLISNVYRGIIDAKLSGENMMSDIEEQLDEWRGAVEDSVDRIREKYEEFKDFFDKFQ